MHGSIDILDLKNIPLDRLKYKQVTAAQGRANPQSMIEAIQLGAMLAKKS